MWLFKNGLHKQRNIIIQDNLDNMYDKYNFCACHARNVVLVVLVVSVVYNITKVKPK